MDRLEVVGGGAGMPEPPQPQVLGQVMVTLLENPDGSQGVAIQHTFESPIVVLGVLEAGKSAVGTQKSPSRLVTARGPVPRS